LDRYNSSPSNSRRSVLSVAPTTAPPKVTWQVSCIDLQAKDNENKTMYPDRFPSDRLPRESSNPLQFRAATDDGADNRGVPPLPNPPNSSDNPEFTKWWRRWMSRVRLTALRNPAARRFHIGRNNKDKSRTEDKAAQANGADRVSARESGDRFNNERPSRSDHGEVRHRNNLPPATRAISGEAEFKRYL
jgi:hypothetical protein